MRVPEEVTLVVPQSGVRTVVLKGLPCPGPECCVSAHPASFTERLLTVGGVERWVTAMPAIRDAR